jgi:hypothetical protein
MTFTKDSVHSSIFSACYHLSLCSLESHHTRHNQQIGALIVFIKPSHTSEKQRASEIIIVSKTVICIVCVDWSDCWRWLMAGSDWQNNKSIVWWVFTLLLQHSISSDGDWSSLWLAWARAKNFSKLHILNIILSDRKWELQWLSWACHLHPLV